MFKSTVEFSPNLDFLISKGSAATYLRCGGQCYTSFVANFIIPLAMKEFFKRSVLAKLQLVKSCAFLGTQCIAL